MVTILVFNIILDHSLPLGHSSCIVHCIRQVACGTILGRGLRFLIVSVVVVVVVKFSNSIQFLTKESQLISGESQ